MDLGKLEATFEANKAPVLAAAGAGVIGLALYSKSKRKTADPAAAAGSSASAGGQVAGATGGAAYDSSASDLYGAIQPQLESLGGQLTDLSNRLNGQYSTPVPVPAPTPDPAPAAYTGATGSYSPVGIPTPVPAAAYVTQQLNAAGGGAAYTPAAAGSALASNGYVGRIDSTATPSGSQYYTPIATGVGQQALLSSSALPQTGSAGAVGSLITRTPSGQSLNDDYARNTGLKGWRVDSYTFNGIPNLSYVY
jgi:hypothetical protein